MHEAGHVVFGGVFRNSGDLRAAVDAGGRLAEIAGGVHGTLAFRLAVIPGRATRIGASRRPGAGSGASPESITTAWEYGFRARGLKPAPRNDNRERCQSSETYSPRCAHNRKAASAGVNFSLSASATARCVTCPSCTLSPLRRCGSRPSARRQPWSASVSTNGKVTLLSAKVEVRATAPGMLVTQ